VPHITKIEMRGFKSFGNTKVTIPLSKGLTAIIGPNGNGKSNIVDALCFVLGEMSAKSMRAERFSDLLFRGGDGQRPAPFAEVSIHFSNEDGRIPVGAKEVVVSRWVNRSGKCVYRINDRRVNRQEIVDLLAPVMASPGGYNFVMQGDVGFFVKMSPVERRLVIDEMAGVAEYDEKKAKAVDELAKVESNLSNAGSVLGEISRRMESLKEQMQTALRCRELTAELEQVRGAMLALRRAELERRIATFEDKIKRLGGVISGLNKRIEDMRRKENSLRERIRALESAIEEKQGDRIIEEMSGIRAEIRMAQDLLRSAEKRRAELERELSQVEETIAQARNEPGAAEFLARFRELHARFRELARPAVDDPQRLAAALEEMKSLLDEICSVLDGIERALFASGPERGKREPSIQELRERRAGIMRTVEEVKEQVRGLEERLASARSREEELKKDEARVRSSIERLRSERNDLRGKADSIEARRRGLEERVRGADDERRKLLLQKESCETELQRVREEMKKLRAEPALLEGADLKSLERRAQELEQEIASLGEVNYRAIRDFREEEKRYESEKARYDKLVAEKEAILDFMRRIDEKKKEVFMKTFNEISQHFSSIFSELSPGGVAQLVLENQESPFEGGIDIIARPQGKNFVSLESLSGGEKALTALAFIFALQRYRPTMFYVLDEIDAHLDPQNRKRVAEMLRKFSRDSQILVITLHDTIMSVADRLFGITMEDHVSRVFSVELSGLGG